MGTMVNILNIETDRPERTVQTQIWLSGYKTFSMLNSAMHEILNANKYENIKKFSIFQA